MKAKMTAAIDSYLKVVLDVVNDTRNTRRARFASALVLERETA
jgi:hypothetical protein